MSTKAAAKKPRKVHRDMPENPRKLAQAMFNGADRKIKKEVRAARKSAAQGR